MSYTYAQRKRTQEKAEPAAERSVAPGPDLNALMAGTAKPTAAQKGRPIELGAAIKEKMENAFGDLSAVKLYESPTVGAAGAEAMAQGSEIAFAPGMADFSTTEGQARLGHELSHVAARRSGAVSQSSGFLNDRALEARADREGMMAAAGQQVYTGPVTGALSGAAPSPAAAGPMQAKRRDADAQQVKEMQLGDKENYNGAYATPDYAGYKDLNGEEWEEKVHSPGFSRLFGKKKQRYKVWRGSEEDKQARIRQTMAPINVDRLFRIHAARMAGKAGESMISEDDSIWFDYMRENADLETFQELFRRYSQSARELVQYRDAVEDPDPLKKNYEAAWSDPGLNVDIYNTIATEMAGSSGADQFGRLVQEEDMRRMNAGEGWSEESKIQQEAGKIRDANAPEVRRSYLYNNPDAMADYERRVPLRNQRYLELALAMDEKKQKRIGGGKAKPQNIMNEAPPLLQDEGPGLGDNLIKNEAPRSKHAADFDLLNSQQGSAEERRDAYDSIALPTAKNMTKEQSQAVSDYIGSSSFVNTYLRGQKNSEFYPDEKILPGVVDQIDKISQVVQSNPLPEQLTTYRGTTDKFLAALLLENNMGKAVNKDGTINHKWLNKNQKKLRKNLLGKTFHEKAFTSTSTEKSFAQSWSQSSAMREKRIQLLTEGKTDEYDAYQQQFTDHPEQTPGAHLLTMNLPKGSKGAFIDRTTDGQIHGGQTDQREVLLDKGSTFKISDIRKMKDADSYELVMELLAEEEGKKKNGGSDLYNDDPLNNAISYGKGKKRKKIK